MADNNVLDMLQGKAARIIKECAETGEPVFVFRAKDIFTPMVVRYYQRLVEDYGPLEHQFIQDIESQAMLLKNWQRANVAQVRYPD